MGPKLRARNSSQRLQRTHSQLRDCGLSDSGTRLQSQRLTDVALEPGAQPLPRKAHQNHLPLLLERGSDVQRTAPGSQLLYAEARRQMQLAGCPHPHFRPEGENDIGKDTNSQRPLREASPFGPLLLQPHPADRESLQQPVSSR